MHSPFSHNLRGAYSGLANTARQAYNIQRHTLMYSLILHNQTSMLSLIHRHTHNRNTHILPPAHVERHSQALSLDKRQRKRRREEAEAQGRGVEEEERYWMYLPRFWSHPSLTMVTSLMVPSRRVWCRCTPAPLREREGGGEERRREREGEEEERRGGGPALPASASLSLPSFPVHPLVRAASLLDTHTQTRGVYVYCTCVSTCFLLWLNSSAPSLLLLLLLLLPLLLHLLLSRSLSRPSSSPAVTQPVRKWKERKIIIQKKVEMGLFFFLSCWSPLPLISPFLTRQTTSYWEGCFLSFSLHPIIHPVPLFIHATLSLINKMNYYRTVNEAKKKKPDTDCQTKIPELKNSFIHRYVCPG